MHCDELKLQAAKSRKRLIELIFRAGAGHTGGDLSCLNVLTALYFHTLNVDAQAPKMPLRDRFILSKGHCVEALYTVLEARGFIAPETTDTLGSYLSPLAGHPTVEVPGIEVNSGALGHGLSIGVGMALAAKMDKAAYRTFVLMGDGEQGEGSIYEAAMAAAHYRLSNLVAIIDRNGLQISGHTEEVMQLEDIYARWSAFGWEVTQMNGDDMTDIVRTLDAIDYTAGRPHLIISHTTKGLGVSFMEGVAKWHHGVPSQAEYEQAIQQLTDEIHRIEKEEIK
ncbi:MAG: transketolase [Prevotellaceae bacterium]|jgi:transketolase|nr:transketolase [Prevotellaceae bacterium]